MIRTGNADVLRLNSLTGIRATANNMDDVVEEVHGMTDSSMMAMQRLPGKVLHTTSVTSTVWSIASLRFRDINRMMRQDGVAIISQPDMPEDPGLVMPPIEFPPIPEPPPPDTDPPIPPVNYPPPPKMEPSDFPESYEAAKTNEEVWGSNEDLPTLFEIKRPFDIVLSAVPSSVTWDYDDSGGIFTAQKIEINAKTAAGGYPDIDGFYYLHVQYSISAPWLIVDEWASYESNSPHGSGYVHATAWTDGGDSEAIKDLYVDIREDLVPYGTTVVVVYVSLVRPRTGGNPVNVLDKNGTAVNTSITVTVTRARGLAVIGFTPSSTAAYFLFGDTHSTTTDHTLSNTATVTSTLTPAVTLPTGVLNGLVSYTGTTPLDDSQSEAATITVSSNGLLTGVNTDSLTLYDSVNAEVVTKSISIVAKRAVLWYTGIIRWRWRLFKPDGTVYEEFGYSSLAYTTSFTTGSGYDCRWVRPNYAGLGRLSGTKLWQLAIQRGGWEYKYPTFSNLYINIGGQPYLPDYTTTLVQDGSGQVWTIVVGFGADFDS